RGRITQEVNDEDVQRECACTDCGWRDVSERGVGWPRVEEKKEDGDEDHQPGPGETNIDKTDRRGDREKHSHSRNQKVGAGKAFPQFVASPTATKGRKQAGSRGDRTKS